MVRVVDHNGIVAAEYYFFPCIPSLVIDFNSPRRICQYINILSTASRLCWDGPLRTSHVQLHITYHLQIRGYGN